MWGGLVLQRVTRTQGPFLGRDPVTPRSLVRPGQQQRLVPLLGRKPMKLHKFTINFLIVALLLTTAGCFGSSPTGPSGPGGSTGTTTFSGPQGYLEVSGSSAFGTRFEPDTVMVQETGVARGVQFIAGEDRLVGLFFNTVNLLVTQIGAVEFDADKQWHLDDGVGVPVSGVTVLRDGDVWVLQFNHAELPGALGTVGGLTLYGELRTDM